MNKEDMVCVCVCVWCTHIYNGILLSHKKIKIPFSTTWMYLEIIILSEVNQREKDKYRIYHKYHIVSLIFGI